MEDLREDELISAKKEGLSWGEDRVEIRRKMPHARLPEA